MRSNSCSSLVVQFSYLFCDECRYKTMKIRIHWVGVEHSTNILVKKVPDGVSHEDDLEVGVVPLGSRLVLHLKQDAQCVLHRHLKYVDGFAHRHVHFVADETEPQGVQLLQHFQQPLKPARKKLNSMVLSLGRDLWLERPFLLVYWRQVKLHSKLLHLGPKTIEKLEQNMKVTLSRAPDSIHWGKAVNSDPSMSTFKNIAIVWITQSPTSP